MTPGQRFRLAVEEERPLQCMGAINAYHAIRSSGTQQGVLPLMQTRRDLYDFLGYHDFEQKLDQLFAQDAD